MDRREFFRRLNEKLGIPSPNPADPCRVEGAVHYKLRGPDGEVKQQGTFHNLVTSVGDMFLAQFCAFVAGATVGSVSYAQLGVGTATPLKADTSVTSIAAASSRGITATYPQRVNSFGTGAGEWCLWQFDWAAGVTTNGSLGEVGMWTSVGSFVAHAILSPNVNKGVNDSLMVQWAWKFQGS